MQGFYAWGDPYSDQTDDIQVADPVLIKPGGPMLYAGHAGWCIDIDNIKGSYVVMFPGGLKIIFDQDAMIKLKTNHGIRWLFERIRQEKGNMETAKLIE